MTAFAAVLKKEFLLLFRDLHGLLLMFVMPVIFIIIMSLAMQQNFAAHSGAKLKVLVHDLAANNDSKALVANLHEIEGFDFISHGANDNHTKLAAQVQRDKAAFLMTIRSLSWEQNDNPLSVSLLVAPGTTKQTEALFVMAMKEVLRGLKVERMLAGLDDFQQAEGLGVKELAAVELQMDYAYQGDRQEAPSAVQQSVPAWLVFAMFFVVVPLSNTLIRERHYGTLRRLKTIAIPPVYLVLGKLLPYFLILQLQVVCMLAVGVYLIPLLGGDRLHLGSSWTALGLIAISVSIAALGYALLIAAMARTTEQATTFGGAGNIILAALGGIMVPRFLMPPFLQELAQLSPLAWGLEGFLDVLLRNGGVAMVWSKAALLCAFGSLLIVLALAALKRSRQ